jgi:hypothetical protein
MINVHYSPRHVPRHRAKAFIKLTLVLNIHIHLLPSGQNRLLVVFEDKIESQYWHIFFIILPQAIFTLNCAIMLLNYTFQTLEELHSFTPSVL